MVVATTRLHQAATTIATPTSLPVLDHLHLLLHYARPLPHDTPTRALLHREVRHLSTLSTTLHRGSRLGEKGATRLRPSTSQCRCPKCTLSDHLSLSPTTAADKSTPVNLPPSSISNNNHCRNSSPIPPRPTSALLRARCRTLQLRTTRRGLSCQTSRRRRRSSGASLGVKRRTRIEIKTKIEVGPSAGTERGTRTGRGSWPIKTCPLLLDRIWRTGGRASRVLGARTRASDTGRTAIIHNLDTILKAVIWPKLPLLLRKTSLTKGTR